MFQLQCQGFNFAGSVDGPELSLQYSCKESSVRTAFLPMKRKENLGSWAQRLLSFQRQRLLPFQQQLLVPQQGTVSVRHKLWTGNVVNRGSCIVWKYYQMTDWRVRWGRLPRAVLLSVSQGWSVWTWYPRIKILDTLLSDRPRPQKTRAASAQRVRH